MPDINDPNMDPRIKEYLQRLQAGSQDTSADQTAIDAHNAQVSNSLIASLGRAGAQMGSIGGKTADTSAMDTMAEQMNRAQRDISQRQADTAKERQAGNMKVYEYLANKAQSEAAAKQKSASDLAAENRKFAREKELIGLKGEQERTMAELKTPEQERKFNALPKEQQRQVTDLGAKNASKQSIANQMRSGLSEFQAAKTPDDRVRLGRQMLKILNSSEGADAVGAEEAKRLGDALEYKMFNMLEPGPAFGRDLQGFEQQVASTIRSVEKGIDANNQVISDIYSGKPSGSRAPVETVLDKDTSGQAIAGPRPTPSQLPEFDPKSFLKGP